MKDLRAGVLATPDKPAYIMGESGEVVTAMQMENRCNRLAHLFRELGLGHGDHIAILMENNVRYLEVCSAAARAGLWYTAISTHLTLPEIEYIVEDCEAKVFITSLAKAETAAVLIDRLPGVQHRLMIGGVIDGYESYEERVAGQPVEPIADQLSGQDMLYSSGTTGRPKAVKMEWRGLPYGELIDAGHMLIALYGFNEDTVYLSPAPLYHAAPLRFCLLAMYAGGTVIVMERFDALQALSLIERYKVTHSQWVPTMFIRMLKLAEEERRKFDVSSQKIAIHAAAPMPVPVKEQMIDWWGPILFEYYAGTEANGLTAITSPEWLEHKGSVGRSFLGAVKILDPMQNEIPIGEIGDIYFADGPQFEYHNDPGKTETTRSRQGWTTIGDVGYVDEEGYLYLTDRKSNMIISGGVNIYPQEAENVLIMHPKISDVAVIGVPHEEFGEEVKAVVQPRSMADAGPELARELMDFCRERLSKIKCPVSVDFEEELPRTPTGKLLKRLIKEKYWKGHESTII